jgi:hypothetical protein
MLSLGVEANPFNSSADSSITKIFYGGTKAKVPEHKEWKIQRAFITNDNGYNILIHPSNFKIQYQSGEIIVFPLYIPEMELLDSKELPKYLVYIEEI